MAQPRCSVASVPAAFSEVLALQDMERISNRTGGGLPGKTRTLERDPDVACRAVLFSGAMCMRRTK